MPLPGVIAEIPPGVADSVIVVDNGSTDRTAEVARQAGASLWTSHGRLRLCLRGRSAAAGERGAEVLVFLDADGSFDPAQIPDLLAPIEAGQADLVLGSRPAGGMEPGAMPPHARFGNWLVARLMRLLYGLRVTDLGPYRAIRADLLAQLDMQEMTYGWPTEMMVKAARHGRPGGRGAGALPGAAWRTIQGQWHRPGHAAGDLCHPICDTALCIWPERKVPELLDALTLPGRSSISKSPIAAIRGARPACAPLRRWSRCAI